MPAPHINRQVILVTGGGGPIGLPAAPGGYEYRRVIDGGAPLIVDGSRVFALVPIGA